MSDLRQRFSAAVVAAVIGSIPMVVSAASQDAANADTATLQEVVVTAERRESSVQTTPIAITAITSEDLEKLHIDDVKRLGQYVPGITVASHGFNAGGSQIAIRGIGSANLIGDPTVAIHIDGQYFPLPRSLNSNFFDLQRVEVLKGPQGTLYGRNSNAGVVNLIAAAPENQLKAKLTTTVGDYGHVGAQGVLNVPIVDSRLAARLAVNYDKHDGYQRATKPGQQDIYDANDISLRGGLLYTPSEQFSLKLSADYFHNDANGPGYQNFNNPYVATLDPFKNYFNAPLSNKQNSFSYRATMHWKLGGVNVDSLSAYQIDKLNALVDQDGNDVQVGISKRLFRETAFQQELRVSGGAGSTIEWQVGAFFYKETVSERFFVEQDLVRTASMPPVPPFIFITPAGVLDPIFNLTLQPNERGTKTYALFTHNKWRLTDKTTLTLGARYNDDEKTFYQVNASNPAVAKSARFKSTTWKAGVDRQLDDRNMIYASVGTGFKSGGVNEGITTPDFKPEKMLAFEIGSKSTLSNDKVRLNAAAFYYDYTDLQATVVVNNQGLTSNASGAKVYGGEFDSRFLFGSRFSVDLSATYLHSKVGNLQLACPMNAPPNCPGIVGFFGGTGTLDVTGNPLALAPKLTANLGLEYSVPLGGGSVTARASYMYRSAVLMQMYATYAPFDVMRQGGVGTADASLKYERTGGKWFGELFVNNLTDARQLAGAFVIPPSNIYGGWAPPRTVGARVGWRFE